MPVQINEIIIRAVVNPAPANNSNSSQPSQAGSKVAEYEAIQKVLEIIKEKQER